MTQNCFAISFSFVLFSERPLKVYFFVCSLHYFAVVFSKAVKYKVNLNFRKLCHVFIHWVECTFQKVLMEIFPQDICVLQKKRDQNMHSNCTPIHTRTKTSGYNTCLYQPIYINNCKQITEICANIIEYQKRDKLYSQNYVNTWI